MTDREYERMEIWVFANRPWWTEDGDIEAMMDTFESDPEVYRALGCGVEGTDAGWMALAEDAGVFEPEHEEQAIAHARRIGRLF